MTSPIIFKVDTKLKHRAMIKARREGVALSAILKLATEAFADGVLHIGLIGVEKLNITTKKEIEQALEDIKNKKHLSPQFKTSQEAIAYLDEA